MINPFKIIILFFILTANAYANIYNCNIKDSFNNGMFVEANLVINVDENSPSKPLVTINPKTGIYEKGDIIVSSDVDGRIGQLIVTSQTGGFLHKGSYQLYVSRNSAPGSNNYFTGVFYEASASVGDIVHSLTISPWNMQIYVFLSDQPEKVFKGTCK
jgi:hypothetical protein